MKTQSPTKDAPLLKGPQLVQSPELITVKTISQKIVDQLKWLPNSTKERIEELEFIGRVDKAIIVRAPNGEILKMEKIVYTTYLMDVHGMSNPDANDEARKIPQMFTA